ncbi:MAG: PH domain-containing protein [Alphaproteobacteria bacterium]
MAGNDSSLSRFLRDSLTQGEVVVFNAKFHWFYHVVTFIVLALWLVAGGLFGMWFHWTAVHVFGPRMALANPGVYALMERLQNLPMFVCAGLAGFAVLKRVLVQITTEAVVTNKRLLFKRGIFSVQASKMALKEVNYAEIKQSLLGNILGYGQLHIYTFTLDDKNISIPNIAKPSAFNKALDAAKSGTGQPTDRSAMPPGSMGHTTSA